MTVTMVEDGGLFPAAIDPASEETPADYLVVLEQDVTGCSAFVPDLPGVVAAGDTEEEVRQLIAEAITFHIEGLREDGDPVPLPSSRPAWVKA